MASVQELVPLIKTAVADVLAGNPSDNGDVRLALAQVTALWNNPEHPFSPSEEPGGGNGGNGGNGGEAPTIASIDPTNAPVDTATDVTLNGTGFDDTCTVLGNGTPILADYVNEMVMVAHVPGIMEASAVTLAVDKGGTLSNEMNFIITAVSGRKRQRDDEDEPERGRDRRDRR